MKSVVFKRSLSIMLALMLVLGCVFSLSSVSVFAKTLTSTTPDKLDVYVKYKGSTDYKLLKSYTTSAFEGIGTNTQMYSYIDQLPTVVYVQATGVYLSDMIADLGLSENDVKKISFSSTDGASKSGTLSSWTDSRYYFPNLSSSGWTLNDDNGIQFNDQTAAMEGQQPVKPMLAVTSNWKRVPSGSSFESEADNTSQTVRFRLLMGQTESEVSRAKPTASGSLKWIEEVKLDLAIEDPNKSNQSTASGSGGSSSGKDDKNTNTTGDKTSDKKEEQDKKADNVTKSAITTSSAVTTTGAVKSDSTVNGIPKPDINAVKGSLKDINGHWAENDIYEMVALGAINGYQDGTFKPSDSVTRAEFTTMLVKALVKTGNAVIEGTASFNDTKNHWANSYIATAVDKGIVSGYDASTFGANDMITREQMAVMMENAMKLKAGAGALNASDSQQISSWAKDAVKTMYDNGIMSPGADGKIRPKDNASRAEAATVIWRALEKAGYVK